MEKELDKSPEEKFLARWSRRKVATAEQAEAGTVDTVAPQSSRALSERRSDDAEQDAQTKKQILTDEHMPPIESLTEDSDFSGFLSPGVSDGLRKQALRKLFGSPGFNIRDGLDDYDDDFRNFAALGDLITSDMKHQMELAEERKRKAQEAEAETQTEDPNDAETDNPPDDDEEADKEPADHKPTNHQPADKNRHE